MRLARRDAVGRYPSFPEQTRPMPPRPPGSGNDPVRVVRVIARLNVGGVARHVAWLSAALQPPEYQSVLVAGTVADGEDDMTAFALGQGVVPLRIPQMGRAISLKDAVTAWKLYRLFVRLQPAIVHTHTAKAGTVGRVAGWMYRWLTPAALVGRPRGCRFVHTFHGHIFHSYYGPLKTRLFVWIERLLARLVTDRIITLCPQQRREIHETFGVGRPGQFAVIPLGLDLSVFAGGAARRSVLRSELGAGDGEVLVGIVGRLTEIKNHRLFLDVARHFRDGRRGRAPAVRFVIIGDGHLRADLEDYASRLGLGREVVFLGMRNDPAYFYPALDVVALTSRNEGTPLTLIEAMANERPVIATNVGGVVHLLGEARETPEAHGYSVCQRGLAVPSGDAAAFSAGLARLVHDEGLRRDLAQRGRAFVEQNYSKDRLVADIIGLYRELLRPAPADQPQLATAGSVAP
jgi:glycosyltransferase involved in cell wall biosynthesis